MLFIHHQTEYEIEIFCPSCGSKNVIVDYSTGFFTFEECLKCGYSKKQNNRFRRNGLEHHEDL